MEAEPLLSQGLAWSVPTKDGLHEMCEAGRDQWELFLEGSCLGFPMAGLAAGPPRPREIRPSQLHQEDPLFAQPLLHLRAASWGCENQMFIREAPGAE